MAVLSALSVAAVVACGNPTDGEVRTSDTLAELSTQDLPVAAEPAALVGPGTELVGGIEVQEGSHLVATPFPIGDPQGRAEDAWQAVFVVHGDPVEVWDRHAAALGLAEEASAARSCIVTRIDAPRPQAEEAPTATRLMPGDGGGAPPERFLTEEPIRGENRLRCLAHLGGVSMSMAVGVERSPSRLCWNDTGGRDCSLLPVSHLLVRVTPGAEDSDPTTGSMGTDELRLERAWDELRAAGRPNELPGAPAPIPTGEVQAPALDVAPEGSRLPAEGEPFDDGLDAYLHVDEPAAVSIVPPGGRSLVAPSTLVDCNSGTVAVLEVRSGVDEVIGWFDDADDTDRPAVLAEGEFEGRDWMHASITTVGGYYLDVLAIDAGGDRSTVLLTNCGD